MHTDRKNTIVGGHQRVKVWQSIGNTTVPTVEVNLSLKEEQELNIRLNRNQGEFDFDILANMFEVEDLIDWGFETWELGVTAEPEQNDLSKEIKTLCQQRKRNQIIS